MTLVVISQEILRTICTAAIWLMAFQFFANLLCCQLQRVCTPVAEMSVLEDLLGRIRTGHRHAAGSLSSQLVDVDVARHWRQSFFFFICVVVLRFGTIKAAVENDTRRCLHFCNSGETFWSPCALRRTHVSVSVMGSSAWWIRSVCANVIEERT